MLVQSYLALFSGNGACSPGVLTSGILGAEERHFLSNLPQKSYHDIGVEQAFVLPPAFPPSRQALKGLHCFIQGISSSQNKINSPLKSTDKGFPFHIQQLKNNFLYQR